LLFPQPSIFRLWNWASSLGGGKARIRAFFFCACCFRFFALFFLRAFALFLLCAREREIAKKVPGPTFDLTITKENKTYNKKMCKK
jgi:hypothetical protein